jgi:hypothetical protein
VEGLVLLLLKNKFYYFRVLERGGGVYVGEQLAS